MRATTAVLIAAVVACATISSTYALRGIIVTVPRSLERNAINIGYGSFYGIDAPGSCSLSLYTTDTEKKVIAQTEFNVDDGEKFKTIEFPVGETSDYYSADIWANCTFMTPDNYNFSEQDEIYLHSAAPFVVLIQTDKPVYKPGQSVYFRTLAFDRYLRPIEKETYADIWVEDPTGSRIAQWLNQSMAEGIQQFHFPLSEEPPLGNWKITVSTENSIETAFFDVQKYVLPKFEVTIKTPSVVLADAETILYTICATYTYGKDVQGILKINCSLEQYSWSNEKFPVLEHEGPINGCFDYLLNVSLVDKDYSSPYRRIQLVAEVTEDETDIKRNNTSSMMRTFNPYTMEFLDDDKQYFKPGVPLKKKVKVTKADSTPAANEPVQICGTISRQRTIKTTSNETWWSQRKVKYCRNYTSGEDGIVVCQVPPQRLDTNSLYLEAKCLRYDDDSSSTTGKPKLYPAQTSISVQPYYSPSKSFIQVRGADDKLQCGTTYNIQVLYTAKHEGKYIFHYSILSKGKVVQNGSKDVTFTIDEDLSKSLCKDRLSINEERTILIPSPTQQESEDNKDVDTANEDVDCSSRPIGSTEFSVEVEARVSPSFHFLVYYMRDDDEVVADSAKFKVEKCFQNKVDFKFADEEKQPGAKTSYTLKASPNSLCGTKVVDKSITLLDSSDSLTKEKIFQELQQYDPQQYYGRNHCNDKHPKGGKNKLASSMIIMPPRPWSSSQYADTVTSFEDAGCVILSDMKVLTRPCKRNQDAYGGGYGGIALASVGVRGGQAGAVVRSRVRPQKAYARRRPATMTPSPVILTTAFPEAAFDADRNSGNEVAKIGISATKSVVDVRSYFPETMLFNLRRVGEDGELIEKVTLPHSITTWVGNAVCMSKTDGLGLSDTTTIKGFQAFFTECMLPYSIIRGENVPLIIRTFNYITKCLPITRTINVAEISDEGAVLDEKSVSEDVCICGGKISTLKHMYTPKYVGTLNITVLAESARSSDVCGDQEIADAVARDMTTKPLIVEPEGFPQERVKSDMVCLKDFEDSTFKDNLDLSVPDNAVNGSVRGFISFSGDIMGPAIDGIDRLVQLPTGCGEQNMVGFVPNIVAMVYLKSIGKLTERMKNKATNNLKTGYQRELKYRHPDGSYSAFGVSDKEGSMWLTAFVHKSFCQAQRFIVIDENLQNQTSKWITDKQQPDGCFPVIGKLLHQAMKGGLGTSKNESKAVLTAYVLLALLRCGYATETQISKALECVATDAELTPYKAALYAHAFIMAGNAEKAEVYWEWLSQKAIRKGDEMYWKNINGSKSTDVETAGYVILGKLKKDTSSPTQVLPIIKYLTRSRNPNGGFYSTQDTVVGLEALASFATLVSKDPVNMEVKLAGEKLEETKTITEETKLLLNKYRVPVVPSTVEITIKGEGCALIQTVVRYTTLTVLKQQSFTISVDAERNEGCKTAIINTCAGYLPENQKSNMAIVEIKMVSGFTAITDTLEKLKNDPQVQLKRYDIENNKVVLYFDELTNDIKCFAFQVEVTTPVEDTKPATAKVYDYYAPEKEESASYKIEENC